MTLTLWPIDVVQLAGDPVALLGHGPGLPARLPQPTLLGVLGARADAEPRAARRRPTGEPRRRLHVLEQRRVDSGRTPTTRPRGRPRRPDPTGPAPLLAVGHGVGRHQREHRDAEALRATRPAAKLDDVDDRRATTRSRSGATRRKASSSGAETVDEGLRPVRALPVRHPDAGPHLELAQDQEHGRERQVECPVPTGHAPTVLPPGARARPSSGGSRRAPADDVES